MSSANYMSPMPFLFRYFLGKFAVEVYYLNLCVCIYMYM